MGIEAQHSKLELSKSISGGEGDEKDFGVKTELQASLKSFVGKAAFTGSSEKDGAFGVDGFSIGEASLSGEKNSIASVAKGAAGAVDEIAKRIGSTIGENLDLSVSLSAAGETPMSRNKENSMKIAGDMVASYEKAKTRLGEPGQKSEGGMKTFDKIISQIKES